MKNIKDYRTFIIIIFIILFLFTIYYLQNKEIKDDINAKWSKWTMFFKNFNNKNNENKNEKSENDNLDFIIVNKDDKDSGAIQTTDYVGVYEGAFDPNGPNFIKENSTQFDWKKLLHNLNKINNRKIVKLKGPTNYQFYTQSTTRDRLRLDLDQITKQIIEILNANTYDFSKTNYGDVYIWTDKNNNEEIKYELFLWDKKNYFEIKFLVHVVKFVDNKSAGKYGVKKSPYLFPTYFMGWPTQNQMIPPPDQVIPTMNASNEPNGICPDEPQKIKYLYINQVLLWNSTLVVNYKKNLPRDPLMNIEGSNSENKIGGVWDNKLDYLNVKNDKNPLYQKATDYNKWIDLDEEPKWLSQYPAKEPPFNAWNDEGIYYYQKGQGTIGEGKDPRFAAGTRWSSMALPTRPNFWPNNYTVPYAGEYTWLFQSQSQGINNVFFGGGKR